jgi:hypothetical protein
LNVKVGIEIINCIHLCISANLDANISDKIAINFIKMFNAGPDVSFKGSPTVSPTTAAL